MGPPLPRSLDEALPAIPCEGPLVYYTDQAAVGVIPKEVLVGECQSCGYLTVGGGNSIEDACHLDTPIMFTEGLYP